jgi:ferritin-like metal-binding protein YciE
MTSEQLVIAWLKDAYAMELTLVGNLHNHAKDAQGHPEIESRLREHANQSQRHADLIRQCIERHGESPSTGKNVMGKLAGLMTNLHSGAKDELLKDCLQDCAAEHFEIACYKSLITAARAIGDNQTAQVCEDILHEEQAMAEWLELNIPALTSEQLALAH